MSISTEKHKRSYAGDVIISLLKAIFVNTSDIQFSWNNTHGAIFTVLRKFENESGHDCHPGRCTQWVKLTVLIPFRSNIILQSFYPVNASTDS